MRCIPCIPSARCIACVFGARNAFESHTPCPLLLFVLHPSSATALSESIAGFPSRLQDLFADAECRDHVMGKIIPAAMRGEPTPMYEVALRAHDGTRKEMIFSATARRDATGAFVGVLGVGQVCRFLSKIPSSQATTRISDVCPRPAAMRLGRFVVPGKENP